MTDQKPDSGETTPSTDPSQSEEPEAAAEQPADTDAPAEEPASEADEESSAGSEDADTGADEGDDAEGESGQAEDAGASADDAVPGTVAETEAEAADAAAAGAAWTTTPVAPDPEATEAALAALAAKPEVTLESPETPAAPPPGDEPPDEGTPVLLVGAILVGAFIAALAIVLILFRPFDSLGEVVASPSPSPITTEAPSASASAIPSVDTPNFRGQSLDDAELLAEDYGLIVRATPVETDRFEPGTVLSQDPEAGTAVDEGTTVDLAFAVAIPTVAVPDIVDESEADAIAALDDADLIAGDVTEAHHPAIVAGNVVSQDPEAATEVAPESAVAYVLSLGPETVAVPDIVDESEADAIAALDDADLIAGDVTEAHHPAIVAGNVVSQDPEAATEVAPESAVAYVLSLGPETVAVPDIVDESEADAIAALDDADLIAGDVTEAHHPAIVAGNVVSQDPEAATEVAPESAVAYVLSLGPETVAVPDIVDESEADAIAALDDADLIAGDVTEAHHPAIVAGNVVSQDPEAATEVAPESAVAYVLSLGPEPVDTPEFVGLSFEEAQIEADNAGVSLVTDPVEDATVEPGTVLAQDPSAGTPVAPGSQITLTVAAPPEQVAVPDLSGAAADAEGTLNAAGLTGSASEAYDDDVAAGDVVSQDPVADSLVALGSTVSYVVSLGVEQVAVPDLSGAAADAEGTLNAAGLTGSASEAYDDDVAAGDVVSQDPVADSLVALGSTVSYVVSLGVEQVAVPDLSGAAADAEGTLNAAGLTGSASEAYDDDVAAGDVVSQDPVADSLVALGSTVSYVVSLGVEQVAVPDLSGAAADAEGTLNAAGLTGSASEAYDDDVAAGDVVSQDPVADSLVALGSTVSYVVSLGVEQVAVPDLSGAAADAEGTLNAAGLTGSASEAYDDDVAAGDVVSQDPVADSLVALGSTVSYVVSLGVEQVAVPDLSGAAADAEGTLNAAGLTGSASEAYDDDVAAGDVVSQDPVADSLVALGSTVSYVVSLGVEQVAVPDLSGAAADAEGTLNAAGLTGSASEAYDDDVAAGDVVSQDPVADSLVALGSTVSYVVSLGVEQVAVPDLSGAAADAEGTLNAAGLTGSASEAYDDDVAAGDVVSQDPVADSLVALGSTVSYVVSLGVEQVAVPDLSGAAADAEGTLNAAGLTGSASEAYDDDVAAGDVVSQVPVADSLVALGSTVSYVVSLGVEQVAVPDLSGAAADAEGTLNAAGLTGSASEAYDDDVAAGDVVSQDPVADSLVALGSTVSYVVSLGVEQVAVPDLSGAAADAEGTLNAAGLTGSASEAYDDDVAAGDVVSQDPVADSLVALGSTVSYVVSLGVEQVAVPDLSGAAADAEGTLNAAGLTGSASEAYDDDVAAGDVVSQDPVADSLVALGSTVSYVVSLGVEQVAVPDLSGAAADAEGTLNAAGLTGSASEAYDDDVAAGDVVSQDPVADSLVALGSTVSYVVSLGVEQVAVPDLSGAAADAEGTLNAAGLTGSASEAYDDDVAAGDVVSQDPVADSLVALGSTVSYVVSLGVEQVAVPDLSGAAADAEGTLNAAGLTGSASEAYDDDVAAGDVVSQDPVADSLVALGSTVSYVVSLGVEQVAVPDLSGAAADAEGTLNAAGLTGSASEAYDDDVAAGDVVSQDPVADSLVALGSTVSYVVSLGVTPNVVIPAVRNLPEADAVAALEADGLVVDPIEKQAHEKVAAGDAIKTAPAAGTEVPIGSTATLRVSTGSAMRTVPDVAGQPQAAAVAALEAEGLTTTSKAKANANVPEGDVIKTTPAAGETVEVGSEVVLNVSSGPKPVAVPDVVGRTKGNANTAITDAGLVVGEVTTVEDQSARNTVLDQDPAAGTEVDEGSAVNYTKSAGPPTVAVPDVAGQPQAAAVAALEAEGLTTTSKAKANANVPEGDVIKTTPAAGETVEVGSEVVLNVSSGPKPVAVPDVVGRTKGNANTAITDAGLVVGEVTTVEDQSARNTVLDQDPAAGTEVDEGSAVNYTKSAGPPTVAVPDVAGQPQAAAVAALEAEGLTTTSKAKANANVPEGDVIKTTPAAGETVEVGSEVVLNVSSGPKPVAVPDVVGRTKGNANTAITDAGLVVGEVTTVEDQSARNTVLDQDPAAGTEVDEGSAVNYTKSAGPPTVAVPDVAGQPQAAAVAALEAEGLTTTSKAKANANVPEGDVIKTTPAAGETVEVGSEVVLNVSSGPKPVAVPDVVGRTKGNANTAITDAGLVVGEVTTVEDQSARNTVLDQDPAAGTEVDEGSAVNYTKSAGPPTVAVPDVAGQPQAAAVAALEAEGLTTTSKAKANANVPEGDVIKTTPAAGETVEVGSEVVLNVSSGPKPVAVPDVVGRTKGNANTAITDAGLVVGEVTTVEDQSARNTVLDQDPAAGTEVDEGSAVNYTKSAGPPTVAVPDVAGQPQAAAVAALEAEGLTTTSKAKANANVPEGDVIKTTPAAGETVEVGSEVVLNVSSGPKPVAVPDVVGRTKGNANTAITDAGLVVGEVTTVEDQSARNTVLDQDPAAGTEVDEGSAVNYTKSAGPPTVAVPDVAGQPQAAAVAALEAEGLVVTIQQKFNSSVPDGDAVKTAPAAGKNVEVGTAVTLTVSKGRKPVAVPSIVGLPEADAITALEAAELKAGERSQANDESMAKGLVLSQDPGEGTGLFRNDTVNYVVSLGPVIPERGKGGSLETQKVITQLDEVAYAVDQIRRLDLGNTPYDGAGSGGQANVAGAQAGWIWDTSTLGAEQAALQRLGLLGADDDLASLLDQLYGQALPVIYVEGRGRQSVLQSLEKLNVAQRGQAAREFGRASTLQDFGADAARVGDLTDGDAALAAVSLEQGDGTATMLDWSAASAGDNQSKVNGVVVPGDDGVYGSMPLLLQREYSFPFLEGRVFVDKLRDNGGWSSVNDAWGRVPVSTEQVMHPGKYPNERPTTIDMDGIAGALGGGWSEKWQQTMGELRIGVWLANGDPGTQKNAKSAVQLPNANAAAGWGGDRLVSLDGPDGSWAIVWQTRWDSAEDIAEFMNAASATAANVPGAHAVVEADVSSGASSPVVVLLTSDDATLASVADALGVKLPEAADPA